MVKTTLLLLAFIPTFTFAEKVNLDCNYKITEHTYKEKIGESRNYSLVIDTSKYELMSGDMIYKNCSMSKESFMCMDILRKDDFSMITYTFDRKNLDSVVVISLRNGDTTIKQVLSGECQRNKLQF